MKHKVSDESLYIASWHKLYPNKKRKRCKGELSKRFLFYKLLDALIARGFESKVYVMSSIFIDLTIKDSPTYKESGNSIDIIYLPEKKLFFMKAKSGKEGAVKQLEEFSYDEVLNKIIKTINEWQSTATDVPSDIPK